MKSNVNIMYQNEIIFQYGAIEFVNMKQTCDLKTWKIEKFDTSFECSNNF